MEKTNKKADEIVSELAKETGVAAADVAKLLKRLGLDQSLRRRAHEDAVTGSSSLFKVTSYSVKVATSSQPI